VTPLFNWVGVDYRQWRAISRTLLRADFRVPLAQSGEAYSLRTVRGLLMMAVVNGLVGLASAFVVFVNRDVVLTGTIVLSYVALVLAPSVLTQHGASMLTTSDYLILGPRPVSSRTFLAIRLTNILFHALLTTTFVAIAPIVAFGLAHGPRVGRALAAACAIYAWAIALTLALGAGYGALLRLVGVARLQRAVAYLQLGVGLLMYGGVLLSSQLLGGVATTATMPPEPWPWAIPPAWFAGYVAMAMGNASAEIWVRAALSVVVIGLLLIALRGRLGLDYASRLSEIAVTPAPTARSRSPITPLFTTCEPRAVALLVLAHFRHDLRVRMGVLGILPLLVLYTILGSDNPVSDPFVVAPPGSPEFVGRLPVIATLDDLDQPSLVKILSEPKNALIKQYQKLFDMEDIKLTFTDDALRGIALKAIARKTGARGLRSILEGILLDTMFELPSLEGVEEVVINREVVDHGNQPLMIYAEREDEVAPAS
jgi:hypothetical protein